VARYPIVFLEDPMGEKDWEGWKAITHELGAKVELGSPGVNRIASSNRRAYRARP
jgi:enolase